MRVILVLIFLFVCVATVTAEEIVTPLGDRWYDVRNPGTVVIPVEGVTKPIVICLDEVPGGLTSTPHIQVVPVLKQSGFKRTVTLQRIGFVPVAVPPAMPYASVILEGIPGAEYDVSVVIRGKE